MGSDTDGGGCDMGSAIDDSGGRAGGQGGDRRWRKHVRTQGALLVKKSIIITYSECIRYRIQIQTKKYEIIKTLLSNVYIF